MSPNPPSGGGEKPVLFEVESRAAAAAMSAFVGWAGSDASVSVVSTPDVLMATDTPERCGWLNDEIYFVTIWVSIGGEAFRQGLHRELAGAGFPNACVEKHAADEPDPEQLLLVTKEHGQPLPDVRHLL